MWWSSEGRLQEVLSLYIMGPGNPFKVIRLGSWFLSGWAISPARSRFFFFFFNFFSHSHFSWSFYYNTHGNLHVACVLTLQSFVQAWKCKTLTFLLHPKKVRIILLKITCVFFNTETTKKRCVKEKCRFTCISSIWPFIMVPLLSKVCRQCF